MKRVIVLVMGLAFIGVGCKNKEQTSMQGKKEHDKVEQVKVDGERVLLSAVDMEQYIESEDKMMMTLSEADGIRLQKAIQIIGNISIIYGGDEGIDYAKTDVAFLSQVGNKTFAEVCEIAVEYLKADQQREIDRVKEILGSIRSPKAASEANRYNEAKEDLNNAYKLPITLDDYVYSEDCFL